MCSDEAGDTPLVSVVIPVYNVAEWLGQCLSSVVRQTYDNIEVIVVDDGSVDDSGVIALSHARVDTRIRVVTQENLGLSAARNAGIDVARGKYLLFIDGDDYIHPTMVERLVGAAERDGYSIAMCDYWRLEHGEAYAPDSFEGLPNYLDERRYWLGTCEGTTSSFRVVWNKLWRRELFEGVRFEVGALYEDAIASLALIRGNCPVSIVHEPLYYYRSREGSITATSVPGSHLSACAALVARDGYFAEKSWYDVRIMNLLMLTRWLVFSYGQLCDMVPADRDRYARLRDEHRRMLRQLLPFVLASPYTAIRVIPFALDERLWMIMRDMRKLVKGLRK